MLRLAHDLIERQVDVLVAGAAVDGAIQLPALDAPPELQPLLLIQSYYRLVNALSIARGRDPDRPPHLRKVTETH
jgi:glucosamine--fructose-6-phosphate aminotransferase (isomerizing)